MHRLFLGVMLVFAACSANGADGVGKHLPLPTNDPDAGVTATAPRTAVFAGGCFWCVEGVFQELAGVHSVESGYAGGSAASANYQAVCTGTTGHAEVVRINYDPSTVTFGRLMQVFFSTHNPTQLNAQGPDHGTQYRSAVFYIDEAQRAAAADYIAQLDAGGYFDQPIVTTLERLEAFYPAEDYHQDFVDNNPNQGYVRAIALPKVEKTRKLFPELLDDK